MPVFGGATDEQVYLCEIAPIAYSFCVRYFGAPKDPDRPFEIHRDFSYSSCGYIGILGCYTIEINKHSRSREQLCSSMGHEMYHRVTMRREGVHREPWLNEALAFLASLWFLREQGFAAAADYSVRQCLAKVHELDVLGLRAVRKSKNLWRLYAARPYPPDFASQVRCFAVELQAAVGPTNVCRIVGAASLDEWMSQLSGDERERINKLLNAR